MSVLVRLVASLTLSLLAVYSPLSAYLDPLNVAIAAFAMAMMGMSIRPRTLPRILLAAFIVRALATDSRLVGAVLGVQWHVDYPVEYALGILIMFIYVYFAARNWELD